MVLGDFSNSGSLQQHGTGGLWAERIPLSLGARTFPIPTLRFRMGPLVNARSFTLCRNAKGLRVWMTPVSAAIDLRFNVFRP